MPDKLKMPRGTVTPLTPEEIARLADVDDTVRAEVEAELVPELRDLLNAVVVKRARTANQ